MLINPDIIRNYITYPISFRATWYTVPSQHVAQQHLLLAMAGASNIPVTESLHSVAIQQTML